jgi:hypothetical protein
MYNEPQPTFKKEKIKKLTWDQVKSLIAEDKNPLLRNRKAEILDQFKPVEYLESLSKEVQRGIYDFEQFRGHVFESLVLQEFNEAEDNSLIGDFLLRCLRQPKILGLDRLAYKNPDYLGVVVDAQTKIAYITSIFEVKLSGAALLGRHTWAQLKNFYDNVNEVVSLINGKLQFLKTNYKVDFIPESGLKLKDLTEVERFVVMAKTAEQDTWLQNAKKDLRDSGWGLKQSLFNKENIDDLTRFLLNFYREQKKRQKRQDTAPVKPKKSKLKNK